MSYFVVVAQYIKKSGRDYDGDFVDIGFCDDTDLTLSHRPPRPETLPYDWPGKDPFWHGEDRFISIKSNDRFAYSRDELARIVNRSISIGVLQIKECKVVQSDARRTDSRVLEFTGLDITISLRKKSFEAFEEHVRPWFTKEDEKPYTVVPKFDVGKHESRHDDLSTLVMFRIPSSPFPFPMPRGSETPWDGKNSVGELNLIKRFEFDKIEIQVLRDVQGQPMTFDEAVREGRSALRPALLLSRRSRLSSAPETTGLSPARRMIRRLFDWS